MTNVEKVVPRAKGRPSSLLLLIFSSFPERSWPSYEDARFSAGRKDKAAASFYFFFLPPISWPPMRKIVAIVFLRKDDYLSASGNRRIDPLFLPLFLDYLPRPVRRRSDRRRPNSLKPLLFFFFLSVLIDVTAGGTRSFPLSSAPHRRSA